jgi:hypothetical protein
MKNLILTTAIALFCFSAFSQKTRIDGASFVLNKQWIGDSFSSSSVCDCPGIIIIDDQKKNDRKWIAVYSIAKGDTLRIDHNYVWDYKFSPGTNDPVLLAVDGVNMNATKGSYTSNGGEHFTGYKITAVKGKTSRSYNHIIHMYSNNDRFDLNDKDVTKFLESIRWK